MTDENVKQILISLGKLDDKITAVQTDVTAMKLQFASSSAKINSDIERHAKDIDALHQIHRECKALRCEKDIELDKISKKVSGVELFFKIVSFVSSFIVIAYAIHRSIKG